MTFTPPPISSLRWKTIDDYVLNTPLGVSDCRAEVLDHPDHIALKPGEDERLRRLQAREFCQSIYDEGDVIVSRQLRYLVELFEIPRNSIVIATGLSASDVHHAITGDVYITVANSAAIARLVLSLP